MKKMKKILAVAMSVMMGLVGGVNVGYAAQTATDTEVSDTNEHSVGITVSATISSSFYVSIPADFALAYQSTPKNYNETDYSYYNEYTVGVKGNIAEDKIVTVQPSSLTLTDSADGGNTVTVTVVQDKTTWSRSDLTDGSTIKTEYTNTTGKAYANITRAGSYSGTLTFSFSLADAN